MITFWLCLLFFVSGVAALLFENLWFYQTGLALGNSVWASSLVLTGFMGGLALGNGLAAWVAGRVRRPVRLYAGLELTIGVTGLALVLGLPFLTPVLARLFAPLLDSWWIQPLRLVCALALLLIPATAMGATLPVLVRALSPNDPRFGRVLGRLYGWNTFGAVVGALAGDAFLIEQVGVRGTGLVAFGLDVVAAGAALWLARSVDAAIPAPEPDGRVAAWSRRARVALFVAALGGFSLLALEVVWFRFLQLFIRGTSTTFAVLLAVVLAGIAAGGLVASWLSGRMKHPERCVPGVAFAAAVATVVLYGSFESGPEIVSVAAAAWLAVRLMFPVAALSGVLFTLLGELLHHEAGQEARAAGWLTLANTTGAALGSLAAGFVLLPGLGAENALWLLASGYVLAGILIWRVGVRPASRPGRAALFVCAAASVLVVLYFPSGRMEGRHLSAVVDGFRRLDQSRPIAVREGLTETLVYLQSERFGEPTWHRMVTNGYSMSGTHVYSERYMKLFVVLPVALRPQPRSAVLISYGVGSTAAALTATDSLESIDVVDISPDVLELGRLVQPADRYPLDDPRVTTHVEDGRYFLQTSHRRFDLITGEPPPPEIAGVVSLYTREYFDLIRERLNPGGMVSYWLPVASFDEDDALVIIRAFCDVFSDCTLWSGSRLDWLLVGSRDDGEAPRRASLEDFTAQWQDPAVAPMLREIGIERPEQLGALFMAGPGDLAELTRDTPPLVDDWPKRFSDDMADSNASFRTFASWMSTRVARDRFEESRWVERHFPPGLRQASLPYFSVQNAVDRVLFQPPRGMVDLALLHRALEQDGLVTLPLWALRSDYRRQRAARRAEAKGLSGPYLQAELALGALARRDYRGAFERFRRARTPDGQPIAPLPALYAACRAGAAPDLEPALSEIEARARSLRPESRELLIEVCRRR